MGKRWARNKFCTDDRYRDTMIVYCRSWANMKRCESSFYKNIMSQNCPQSCNKCTGKRAAKGNSATKRGGSSASKHWKGASKSKCKDNYRFCLSWKKRGRCSSRIYSRYMSVNCKLTCGICKKITV